MFNQRAESFIESYIKGNQQFQEETDGFYPRFQRYNSHYARVSFPPAIFTADFIKYLEESTLFLLDMVFSIPERIFNNDYRAMIQYQGYKKEDADYLLNLCQPELMKQAKLLARPDFLLAQEGLKVVEMNVASAIGGIGICDRYAEVFYKTRLAESLLENGFSLAYDPVAKNWADFIYTHSPNIKDKSAPLVLMAVLDKEELKPDHFYSFITEDVLHFMRMNGFRTVAAPLSEIEFRDKGVYFNGMRVDIVLTSFIFIEARNSGLLPICSQLIEAQKKGLITYYGGEINTIFDHKTNLALLASEDFSQYYTEAERKKIKSLVPYTFKLSQANMDDALHHHSKWVLKKGSSFGGTDVVIGTNKSEEEWRALLTAAVAHEESYILQELIEPRVKRRAFTGDDSFYDMCVGGCYFGKFAGILVREKLCIEDNTNIINVTQGATFSAGLYTID